jgi:rhodanese-related sulfurtransferase
LIPGLLAQQSLGVAMRRHTVTAVPQIRAARSSTVYPAFHWLALSVIFFCAVIGESKASVGTTACEFSTNVTVTAKECASQERSSWRFPIVDDDGNPMPSSEDAIPLDLLSNTEFGYYLTAREAYTVKQWLGKAVLFIDVRDLSSGERNVLPAEVDFNLPLIKSIKGGKLELAHGFVGGIKRALATRGMSQDALVVLICVDGRAAALGADLLAQAGVSNTFVVRGGMEGEIGSADNTGWKAQMLPTDVLAAI